MLHIKYTIIYKTSLPQRLVSPAVKLGDICYWNIFHFLDDVVYCHV